MSLLPLDHVLAPRPRPVGLADLRPPLVSPWAPDLHVTLPDGVVATLPGLDWPELAVRVVHDPLGAPPIAVSRVTKREANRLLAAWEHELGEYRRPFGYEAFTLDVAGEPVALAVSGSIVSSTVEGQRRREVVELARLARHPDHPHALRVILRLWRAYLVASWEARYWPVSMAVAYSLPGRTGDLYRFDGWTRVGPRRPSAGGGTWSNTPAANAIADGVKTLWVWRYGGGTP